MSKYEYGTNLCLALCKDTCVALLLGFFLAHISRQFFAGNLGEDCAVQGSCSQAPHLWFRVCFGMPSGARREGVARALVSVPGLVFPPWSWAALSLHLCALLFFLPLIKRNTWAIAVNTFHHQKTASDHRITLF